MIALDHFGLVQPTAPDEILRAAERREPIVTDRAFGEGKRLVVRACMIDRDADLVAFSGEADGEEVEGVIYLRGPQGTFQTLGKSPKPAAQCDFCHLNGTPENPLIRFGEAYVHDHCVEGELTTLKYRLDTASDALRAARADFERFRKLLDAARRR